LRTQAEMKAQAVRRVGAASLDLCWTAADAFDGFSEMGLGPWDMAAGVVILEEAGAKVSDFAVLEGVRRAGAIGEGQRDP